MYPDTPAVFPPSTEPLQKLFLHHFHKNILVVAGIIILPLTPNVLDEGSVEYYVTTREARFGKSLAQIAPVGLERQGIFKRLEDEHGHLATFIGKEAFLGGHRPLFADFVLMGYLLWMHAILPAEEWQLVAGWHGGRWEKLRIRGGEWSQII